MESWIVSLLNVFYGVNVANVHIQVHCWQEPNSLLCTRLPIHQSRIQLHCISLKYLHKVSNMTYRCCHQSKHRDQDLTSHHPIIIVWHWKPIPIFPNKWIIIVFEKKIMKGGDNALIPI